MPISSHQRSTRPGCPGRPSASVVLLLVASALLLATAAGAATYYLSPGGSDSNSGLSPSSPWATVRKANSTLRAGDVCFLANGSYGDEINPSASGTSTNRLSYVGNLASPGAVVVGGLSLSTSWISVKGVKANGGLTINTPAQYDSVAWSVLDGWLGMYAAKHCMVAHNTANGQILFAANNGNPCYDHGVKDPACFANCEFDTLRGNVLNIGNILPGDRAFTMRSYTQNCLLDSNHVTATMTPGGPLPDDSGVLLMSYNSYYNTFRDNRWEVEATGPHPQGNWRVHTLRDSTSYCSFIRDTILAGVKSGYDIHDLIADSGNWPGSTGHSLWDQCFYKFGGGNFYWQDYCKNNTIQNSVIASNTGFVLYGGGTVSSVFRHNTLYGNGQIIRFDGVISGTTEMTSNIIYTRSAGGPGDSGGELNWLRNTSSIVSDNNLFFTPSYTSSPGDRSIMWCCYTGSRPGAGQPWNRATGQDGNSRYGSPLFADSSFANLDPALRAGSAAIGAGAGGSDAGAVPFGPDAIAPSTVSTLDTLRVNNTSLVLTWVAPGDDGTAGRAQAYDLRWSNAPISAANFASATPVSPQPAPASGGTAQSYLVQSLTPGTSYYFAIKAVDEAGNWSGLSNVAHATTTLADVQPPAAIRDLGAQ